MSEYWVSKKKYYCKYCETYIADDAPSRSQHENGMRHVGNKERFVRGLYKTSEKKKKDEAEEAREMQRIETIAQAAYAGDLASGHAKASSSSSASASAIPPSEARPAAVKKTTAGGSSNPFENYSTAAQLGYTDPDAERLITESIVRQSQGRAGAWSTVTPITASTNPPPSSSSFSRKRDREGQEGPVEDDERRLRMKKKIVPVGLGDDLWDAGEIKLKPKVEPKSEEGGTTATNNLGDSQATEKPVWVPRGWKKAGEDGIVDDQTPQLSGDVQTEETDARTGVAKEEEGESDVRPPFDGQVKGEEGEVPLPLQPQSGTDGDVREPPPEEPGPSGGGGAMFKKRKAPTTVGPKKGARRQL